MNYEELDPTTREFMLNEFEKELELESPYISKALSTLGKKNFPLLLREALRFGNHITLFNSTNDTRFWEPMEQYNTASGIKLRKRNIEQTAMRLAITEFSTFYVKGLASRLLKEGETQCEIYRGATPKWEPGDCAEHEGLIVELITVYNNHRLRYWPEPGNKDILAIPYGPGCHHLIRRINNLTKS